MQCPEGVSEGHWAEISVQLLVEQHTSFAFACPKKVTSPSARLVPAPLHGVTSRAHRSFRDPVAGCVAKCMWAPTARERTHVSVSMTSTFSRLGDSQGGGNRRAA